MPLRSIASLVHLHENYDALSFAPEICGNESQEVDECQSRTATKKLPDINFVKAL